MKYRWVAAAGLAVILVVAAPAVMADCVNDCRSATYCDSTMHASGECGRRLEACYRAECNKPTRTYGAIAYGAESTAAGWSYDFGTPGDAGRKALSTCRARGGDCKVVLTFSNSCAALAVADDKRFMTAQAKTRQAAEASALAACKGEGGINCEVQAWSCTRP